MNIYGDLLKIYAKGYPGGTAIYYGIDEKETWKELNDRTNSLANALWDLGIRKGDKGIVMFHNRPELLESLIALQKLGALPAALNDRFTPKEIEFQTDQSDSKVFLTEDRCLENVKKAKPNMPKVENYIALGESGEFLNYEDLIKKYPPKEPEVKVSLNDPCAISYTGGTTGLPKGVLLTYNGFFEQTYGMIGGALKTLPQLKIPKLKLPIPLGSIIGEVIGSDFTNNLLHRPIVQKIAADPNLPKIMMNRIIPIVRRLMPFLGIKMLMPLPMFHIGGLLLESNWLQFGISLCFPKNPRFDPVEILEIIDKLKPQAITGGPTGWKKILEVPDIDKYDRSSLLLCGSAMMSFPAELKKRWFKKFPNSLIGEVFGQAETYSVIMMKVDSSAQLDKIKDKSVGSMIEGAELRILNEKGEDVKPGETGRIFYRSGTIMEGYYKEEEKTAKEFIENEWFHSGDLGYLDEDGELRVVGRESDLINVGGEKIYPREIELILESHPKVEYACLIGVSDETYGEIPRAVIQLKKGKEATEEEIIDWCRGKMAGYKRPKSVMFAELPVNIGESKIEKKKVMERYGAK